MEQALWVLDKDGKFQTLNNYWDKLIKLGLDLCLAQQPFVLSVGVDTNLARYIRCTGEQLGCVYPEHPPQLALYGPNKVADYLTPSSASFIPLPEFYLRQCLIKFLYFAAHTEVYYSL